VQLARLPAEESRRRDDLRLPISGSLDDPQFSIAGLVFKAIVNLVGKALTAPFALLGSMFGGGGAVLPRIRARPARRSPPRRRKVATLAKALTDRPALRTRNHGPSGPGERHRVD